MYLTSKKYHLAAIGVLLGAVLAVSVSAAAFADQRTSRSFDDLVWEQGGPGLHFAL